MKNQNRATRVEAHGSPTGQVVDEVPARYAQFAREFAGTLRRVTIKLADRCAKTPTTRRQSIYDMKRGEQREVRFDVVAVNMAACLEDPSLQELAIEQAVLELEAFLRAQRPRRSLSVCEEYMTTTTIDATADVDMARVLLALQTGNRADLEKGIESVTLRIAADKQLLQAMLHAQRVEQFTNGARRFS